MPTKKTDRKVKKMTRQVKRGLVNPDTGMRTAKGIRNYKRKAAVKEVVKRVAPTVAGALIGGALGKSTGSSKIAKVGTAAGGYAGAIGSGATKTSRKTINKRAANTSPFSNETVRAYKAKKNSAKFYAPKPPKSIKKKSGGKTSTKTRRK